MKGPRTNSCSQWPILDGPNLGDQVKMHFRRLCGGTFSVTGFGHSLAETCDKLSSDSFGLTRQYANRSWY